MTGSPSIDSTDLPNSENISPYCAKQLKPLAKRKKKNKPIDPEAIGTPSYNLLLELLRRQVKHPNNYSDNLNASGGSFDDGSSSGIVRSGDWAKLEKKYSACHAAIMGVGNFRGRKNCAEEIMNVFRCVNPRNPHTEK